MLKTYFRTAWRGIIRNKVYSTLNILGLAIGMAVALLIGLWVHDQSSYDRFLPGYQQAYQVKFNYNNNGEIRTQNNVCQPLAEALKRDIPEITGVALSFGPGGDVLTVGDKRLHPRGLIAGSDFLKIFQFPLIEGSAAQALKDPRSIVLTESTAKTLFGDADPMNNVVRVYGDSRKVTGILKDIPTNSSFQFNYITPFQAFASAGWVKASTTVWSSCYFNLYASVDPHADYARVTSKIKMMVQKYAPDSYKTFRQQVIMQPMKDWHLYTDYKNGTPAGGLIDYIRLFSIIGILVLLIACINFMNLSTARSEKRAREVGVRKVIGSSRQGLIFQFLAESIVLTCLAFLLSLLFVKLALPAFNALTGTSIGIPYTNGWFWLIMLSYVLLTGLLAGCRPAFYLSSFHPAKVLKGALQAGKSATTSRKLLVIVQFTCSVALVTGTIIIYQQIRHAKSRPTGYNSDRLLWSGSYGNYTAIKNEALSSGVVTGMTRCLAPVTDVYSRNTIDDWPGRLPNEPLTLVMSSISDSDYFRTLGMQLVAGRNFTGNPAADSLCAILNESAVKRMRFKDPINQTITWGLSDFPHHLRIIGVVKDALMTSPFAPAEPTIFPYNQNVAYTLMYRLSPTVNTEDALLRLKSIFEKYNPEMPFEYRFVDEDYATKFAFETLIGKLAGIFAALTVFISCLGLFGLAAYLAEQRTKEIGIRKVLGASVSQVWVLLTRDFIVLVLISCALASPIAFYFLQRWLQNYYYRIHIGPGVFIFSAIIAIIISITTISFQAVKAAIANPVKSLRTE
ncbi:MAG: ABC transporter permease [Chitinophagales bacterium]